MLKYNDIPNWIVCLELEDLDFIKKFIKFSGSLKELAREYNVTYPTIRLRFDKLIRKVDSFEKEEPDMFIEKVKEMALNDKIDLDTAKEIIKNYQRLRK